MRFIDLFAGIGGFHQALTRLGHECVFASEKKEYLAELYYQNYGIIPNRNIRQINPADVPDHDILCAGFPCQPFSKAGKQHGLRDETNGSFFDVIVDILREKRPAYFILENVRNIESHDDFRTWAYISDNLAQLGYHIDKNVMSPHQFNIPQHRERLFIVGSLHELNLFEWPAVIPLQTMLTDVLSNNNFRQIEMERSIAIDIWQRFVDALPKNQRLPGFPIWSFEFGATYPIDRPISKLSDNDLEAFRGNFGMSLKGLSYEEKLENLPGYAVKNKARDVYPDWKIRWILDNRKLYEDNKVKLDPILEQIKAMPIKSWKKFEWNCGDVERDLRQYIIQFRASGVRIKRADVFPSLVTVGSQIPIVGWQNRYLTVEEGLRIQSFDNIRLPENVGSCFEALGNAVNVQIVHLIASRLIPVEDPIINQPIPQFHVAAV